ncbi:SpoIIE family protein phosphatase [Maridesulfovibrio frigidus]|uniref:SpoIIE family protein phosphatase n=1 Tax=Maridesulfovibrio frigidus TaxID=340956 RepID=UPI0004E0EF48|nr:SpoIIE family protein phosphatase [Maridesulfovibrio frigidus]
MKIRSKLLLLLLLVSILPLLAVQFNGLDSMRLLADSIGGEVRHELVQKSSVELKRLVEDHARVLEKQRKIVELNLRQLSAELSLWIQDRGAYTPPEVLLYSDPKNEESEKIRLAKKYSPKSWSGMHRNLRLNFRTLRYMPGPASFADIVPIEYMSSVLPLFKNTERNNPELNLWIRAEFLSGESLSYPALSFVDKMHSAVSTVNKGSEINWSSPRKDVVTGKTVLTASVSIISKDGTKLGVLSTDVPLDTLLHGYNHLNAFSHNIFSVLAKAKTDVDGNKKVMVVAEELPAGNRHSMMKMNMWMPSLNQEQLTSSGSAEFEKFQTLLEQGKSGVMSMPYKDIESIWAFSAPDKRGVALILILPHSDVVEPALKVEASIHTSINEQLKGLVYILVCVVLLVTLLAFFMSRRFTESILILAKGVKRISTGDFAAHVEVKTTDEVGELADNFNKMVPSLREHIEIKSAIDVAMEVQTNLLPQKSPVIDLFDIHGESRYCDELGGDYFDYIKTYGDNDRICFAVGDVSGHGIQSAMLMGSARGYLRARMINDGELGKIMTDVNRLIASDTYKTGQFMTMMMVELDPHTKRLRWVRAGHEPALIFDPLTGDFIELVGDGLALGIMDESCYFVSQYDDFGAGQILILGTDGIWEASNEDGEFFGKQRLKEVIAIGKDKPAVEIVNSVLDAVQRFTGKKPQEDDLTIVVIKSY